MLLLSFGVMFSTMFSYMNHPLTLGFMLMIQTLWISLFIGFISKTFWFSYILFITFLGGMLILFIYMTSLSSNEYFNFSFKPMMILMLMTVLIILIMSLKNFYFFNHFNNLDSNFNNFIFTNINSNILNMNKLYNFPYNLLTILLILYLLITLIIVVKMTNIFYGPMRKNF
uniref:NADH-ubiquinone oxidoreductase chain 6 n=1 Tax=Hystrichopsylla weida qinlingensis TaxID=2583743 RepID=A0A4P9JLG8_9NEOP|nr:NADH dehydrogenase subunit 6 [Hystrichopsylla weida qinlingensis]QCU82658.1 NADH dehydrogenase subunit 6 [Hystrichopsylla weida qinlingensis]